MDFMYSYYIAVDERNRVTDGWSDAFPHATDDKAIKICESDCMHFNLDGKQQIRTMDGILLYKWDGTQVIPRTPEEIEADRRAIPAPPPTSEERLRSDTDYLSMMTGINLPSGSAIPMALDLTYSPNFDKVKHYYEVGLWTSEMVQNAVGKWLTQEETDEIFNKVKRRVI